jgi:PIN domain nuclease of toxin-antitoxin system
MVVADDKRLKSKARAAIATPDNNIFISNLSLFECSIKMRIGKLKIDFSAIDKEISENRLLELRYDTLASRQFVYQQELPQGDPFDVAIVAQAISKHMTLITSDDHILESSLDDLYVINATK